MILDNFELNCPPGAVETSPPLDLQRAPETVIAAINAGAGAMLRSPAGMEIQMVGSPVDVVLSVIGDEVAAPAEFWTPRAWVYLGRLRHGESHLLTTTPTAIHLEYPAHIARLSSDDQLDRDFHPLVWRVVLGMAPTRLHEVSGDVRPPRQEELPARRYCAYGTSITHGVAATQPMLGYPAQVARILGMNYTNMGVAGSALCERQLADYLNDCDAWDLVSCEVSVNMLVYGYSLAEYTRLIREFVSILARGNPARQVVLMTPFRYFGDVGMTAADIGVDLGPDVPALDAPVKEYRRATAQIVASSGLANLHFLGGLDLLPSMAGLTSDLIHPADEGMTTIASRLAERLRPIIAALPR